MTRYDYVSSCFLFLFLIFPCGFCLSSNQTNTMITLSLILQNNTASSAWNATAQPDPCLWSGVICNFDNSSVIGLSLSEFKVSASGFLINVCKIDSLQFLDASGNLFSSLPDEFISSCGGLDGLMRLNFSSNQLSGVLPTFSGFVGLECLDLSFNHLSGSLNLQLEGLIALKSLNLSANNFTGSVPVNFGKSFLLEELELSMNSFRGEIPRELLNYRNLSLVDLSGNKLNGSIPNTINNLSKLKVLILSENNLSGLIPSSIANFSNLFRFAANQNQFRGLIPSGITRYLSVLDLSYNSLSGLIPSDLLSMSNLQSVDLTANMLNGSIPANISQNLVRLRLGSNSLDGRIPTSVGSLQKLTYLELDNNRLADAIPPELGSCRNLLLLNLAQNSFTGTLPVQLGNISGLQVLKLQLNKLVGEIPVFISGLQKLSTLNISGNSFTGPIPSSISNLWSLAHLNLQGNKLNGSIPDTISSMNSLLELQLGENQLAGRIPMMPIKLQIALNLSGNLFEGPIPNTLSQLNDLEILDLSNNKFSGAIPDFLTQLTSLTQLGLSNNQLSGIIPKFKPWVVLSHDGNPGLINAMEPNNSPEQTKKKKSTAIVAILSVVSAVLAVGVVATVAIMFSRRYPKVNDQPLQSGEDLAAPHVVQGNLLTANVMHRSNIDFTKAMEAVADPLNVVLKTRFSTYYKATMPSGATYFVKKLNWSDKIFQLGNHDKLDQELEVIGKVNNSNVMIPLAYFLTVDSAFLFYENAQKGTLFDVLHGKLGHALDWASRYSIAVGVAQGLTFLHGYASGPILLLDLSSRNILLKSLKEPLVGDIELYKMIDPTKSTSSLSTVAGTVGYIPPEYAYTMRVTMAGNVYSFGVILLELLTGKRAVSEGTELVKWVLSKSSQQDRWDQILDFNISRNSLAATGQMLAVLKIALSCVSLSPEARPKTKSILRMILNAR